MKTKKFESTNTALKRLIRAESESLGRSAMKVREQCLQNRIGRRCMRNNIPLLGRLEANTEPVRNHTVFVENRHMR